MCQNSALNDIKMTIICIKLTHCGFAVYRKVPFIIEYDKKIKGECPMKKASDLLAKIAGKVIEKEKDSACCIIGYQPHMPESVKQMKNGRKNRERHCS